MKRRSGGVSTMEIADENAYFRSVVDNANDTIVAFGDDGIIVHANPAAERLLGYATANLVGTNFIDYLHPDEVDRALYVVAQIDRQPGGLNNGSFRIRHRDGRWIPADVTAGQGSVDGKPLLAVHCRFSAASQMERQVLVGLIEGLALDDILPSVLNTISWQELGSHMSIAWIEDDELHHAHTGLPEALRGTPDKEPWASVYRTGIADTRDDLVGLSDHDRMRAAELGFGGYWIEPVSFAGAGTSALVTVFTLAERAEPRIHEFGIANAKSYVSVILQFTAQRKLLAHAASHDPLTGLANRKALVDAMEHSVGGAVLYCDLDHFKPVNDRFGHAIGDELLEMVATRLCANVRPEDIVARIGGDEFVILSPGRSIDEAETLANELLDALHLPFELDGHTVEVGVSIGLAVADQFDEHTIIRADRAMYAAKAGGRGAFRWA